MAAGSELTSAAIAPNSTEYGQRGELEAGLASVMGGGTGGGAPPASPSGAAGMGGPTDPIAAMLAGEIAPNPAMAPTGPGVQPGGLLPNPEDFPLQLKLQALAQHAQSPFLRAQARQALRRMTKGRSRE